MSQPGLSCCLECRAGPFASVRGGHGKQFHASDVEIHQPANDAIARVLAAEDTKDSRGDTLNERRTRRSGLGCRQGLRVHSRHYTWQYTRLTRRGQRVGIQPDPRCPHELAVTPQQG